MFSLVLPVKSHTQKHITKKEVIGLVTHIKRFVRVTHEPEEIDAGYFIVTAYTNSPGDTGKSPGQVGYGITASGKPTVEHHTIAADWNLLPNGTIVKIQGLTGTYTVEDTGNGIHGRHIDLFVGSEDEAVKWGIKRRKITIVKG